jgi:hypothetical protein
MDNLAGDCILFMTWIVYVETIYFIFIFLMPTHLIFNFFKRNQRNAIKNIFKKQKSIF